MELHLVMPVEDGDEKPGDEKLNGIWWRVKGPLNTENQEETKYHCVSYVWGSGRENIGGFFNSEIEISDQTRPALEAAMRAENTLRERSEVPYTPGFWIDAICIPQKDGPARYGSLESMGWIYSAATSVIIVLQEATWKVISMVASSANSPEALSHEYMEILEREQWVSSVWTYQEVVNCRNIFFTTASPEGESSVISAEPFFNCIGFCLDRWKKTTKQPTYKTLSRFPNLNTLEDTLADRQVVGYLEFSALSILSNIAMRRFDLDFPKNRILASLGALHKEVAWGKPSSSLDELAEKFMSICEARNDYSFIHTSDERDKTPGLCWRPSAQRAGLTSRNQKPIHLVPIVSFYGYSEPFGETQRGRKDAEGFWLEDMIPLPPAASMSEPAIEKLELWLYGSKDLLPGAVSKNVGFIDWDDKGKKSIIESMFKALKMIGFTGSHVGQVCKEGLFFSQVSLQGKQGIEMFASSRMRWVFGAPGLVRWEERGTLKYSAGVFAGLVNKELASPLLLA